MPKSYNTKYNNQRIIEIWGDNWYSDIAMDNIYLYIYGYHLTLW